MSLGSLTLSPIKRISGKVDLPGSKSLSNRVLLLSMLAEGTTPVSYTHLTLPTIYSV